MTTFNQLPRDVQDSVKYTLSAYCTCKVELNNTTGAYSVTTATVIHNCRYDTEVVGEFSSDDVFTNDEKIVNYIETFREFPYHCLNGAHYDGRKDWKALKSNWKKVELVDGNAVFS